jgi:predicted MFS family arabinose efflux permease
LIAILVGLLVLFSLKNPAPDKEQRPMEYLSNTWKSIQNRQLIGLFLAGITTFIVLYGSYLTYFPLFLKQSFGASPLVIGIMMSVMSIATACASSQLGRLTKFVFVRTLIKAPFILYALASAMIPFGPSLPALLMPMII